MVGFNRISVKSPGVDFYGNPHPGLTSHNALIIKVATIVAWPPPGSTIPQMEEREDTTTKPSATAAVQAGW